MINKEAHDYKETLTILEEFYGDCLEYWLTQEDSTELAREQAIKDVKALEHNPLTPRGKKLDPDAQKDFLKG